MIYNTHSSSISYYKLTKVVFSRWYWMLLAIICGLGATYFYLLITPKQYKSSASLKYEEKKSEISELLSVRNLYDRTNKVESEKSTITSRTVLLSAINSLDYPITFYEKINFKTISIYPRKPIDVTLLKKNNGSILNHILKYRRQNFNEFKLCIKTKDKDYCNIFKYNKPLKILGSVIAINNNPLNESKSEVIFKITDTEDLLENIEKSLKIDDAQNTNILKFKYIGSNPAFCTDILNAILAAYLKYDIKQKENALIQTSRFLNVLLEEISNKTKASASALQLFKKEKKLLNITSFAADNQLVIERIAAEQHALELSSKVLAFVYSRINDQPSNLSTINLQGFADPQLHLLVERYQDLILSKQIKLNVYTESSDQVEFINSQIKDLKSSIVRNIIEHLNLNSERTKFLTRATDSVRNILKTIPEIETEAITLSSRFEVDQKVHLFLAQKKLEAQIVNAAIVPIATILDYASVPEKPIKPIVTSSYLLAAVLSIIAGTFGIIIIHLYNPFIHTKEQVAELTTIPILGVVNRFYDDTPASAHHIVLKNFSRSSFSESIRFIRGNLNFLAPDKGKVICITSSVSGEGKSLISVNLAYSLTLTQKKVLIIAADLRKSALHLTFNVSNNQGLSSYLSGQANFNTICSKTTIENLDLITAGTNPPNPSELLQGHMMVTLIEKLRPLYDVIIIDSAPIGLISDIKPIMKCADINLFILRSGVSKPGYVELPERLKEELNLPSVAIILNDFKSDNFHNHYYKDG
jgi:tyrosine-protein kinase Etk/Wzc